MARQLGWKFDKSVEHVSKAGKRWRILFLVGEQGKTRISASRANVVRNKDTSSPNEVQLKLPGF